MRDGQANQPPVLIAGEGKLTESIAVCLMEAGQQVFIYTASPDVTVEGIRRHFRDMENKPHDPGTRGMLTIVDTPAQAKDCQLAIVITQESVSQKKSVIGTLENVLLPGTLIAINTESIALSEIQQGASHPERIIGANWVEPAHTTYFLEIICNSNNPPPMVEGFAAAAKKWWNKDPYVLHHDLGIRSRLLSALVREAFYLVENGYVSFEDIDRACRNDAGYYLPFAGNFRYMDLMGTYIYGIVMKEMNPALSKDRQTPRLLNEIIRKGGQGMDNNKGFYEYDPGQKEQWDQLSRDFSYQLQSIIKKYSDVY